MKTVTTLAERMKQAHTSDRPRRRRWRWIGALLLLLLIVGTVWAVRTDSDFERVQQLQKELARGKDLPLEERKAKFEELRSRMKNLTDDQKWELGAPMREKQKTEMDRYFAMSPKEKTKYLDDRIDKSEAMRKEWEKKAGQNKGQGGPGPGSGGKGFGPGGGSGKQPKSADAIESDKKARLDRTSADERARMDLYRKEMNDRRKQRGLSTR